MIFQPLYKLINNSLHYWEIWEEEDHYRMHWGVVGEKGEVKAVDSILGPTDELANLMIDDKLEDGYDIMDFDSILIIEYPKDSNYANFPDQAEKLETWISDFLKWRALGITSSHTVNETGLEIVCYVVDYIAASEAIAVGLRESNFGPCSQILRREIPPDEEDVDADL